MRCIVEVVGRWMDVLRRTDCSTGYLSHPAVKKATRYCNTISTAPTGGAEGMYCNIITIVPTLPCSNVSVAMNPLPCSNVSVPINPLPCSNVSVALNPLPCSNVSVAMNPLPSSNVCCYELVTMQ